MRLIDADELLQEIEESANVVEIQIHLGKCDKNVAKGMLSGLALVRENILRKPTVYDTEAVLAELEKEKYIAEKEMEECIFKALPYHDSIEGKVIGIKKAIEIVRKGGV